MLNMILKSMKLVFFSFLFFVSIDCSSVNEVQKTSLPRWIKNINSYEEKTLNGASGYQYCLIDLQENLIEQSLYRHYAIKILNSEGIQSMSDIDVTFDPTYQKLQFHKLQVVRDGIIIDKLKDSDIKLIQREKNLEKSIYDGALTAIINLKDIRENDVIEYSYTIIGFNPINKGKYSTTFYQEYTVPANRIFNRIVVDKDRQIRFRYFEKAIKPMVSNKGDFIEYLWDIKDSPYKLYDNNVPIWFDNQRRVSVSMFDSWKDVVDWAIPLYNYSEKEIKNVKIKDIKSSLISESVLEERILEIIRFVQDEIRYFGLESGISAYKPNNPIKIFNQRYGDCKDKSLLLVSLLHREGISAFPVLVNSQLKFEIENQLPSNSVFDHCIVNFSYKGRDYFIDPTVSSQGGNLENISFPEYKRGLLIKPNQSKLVAIPESNNSKLNITEIITVKSIGGDAEMMVRTEYFGSKADNIRSYFNTNSRETIQKEFLDYYSSLYSSIEVADEIRLYDNHRNSSNLVVIEEYYNVKKFWLDADDKSYYCEIYPIVLESQLNYPKSSKRNMPYYIGGPSSFSQTTTVYLPEEWRISDAEVSIVGEGFVYENNIKGNGKSVSITHNYELQKEYIDGNSVSTFIEKHGKIKKELSYYLTYNPNLNEFKLSWISIIIAFIAVGLGIFFAIKIYRNFNPSIWEYVQEKSIGGWLILPAIGITITPLVLLIQIISQGHFNQNSWLGLFNHESGESVLLISMFGAEIIYNFLLFVFSILLLVLFYQRRTNVPILITIFYIISIVAPLVDLLIINQIIPNYLTTSETSATYKSLVQSIISAAIWIPYFNISERAKNTFCRVYKKDNTNLNFNKED